MRRIRRSALTLATALCALAPVALPISPARAQSTWAEQEGHHGDPTFQNPTNASGQGPSIAPYAWVNVTCKLKPASTIASAYPDGYWYLLSDSPWNNQYYAVANTFYNGDPIGGPYTHNTDLNVPDCGSNPAPPPPTTAPPPPPTTAPPPPAPSVSLSQGPAAPLGYRYAITLNNFPGNMSIPISCRDTADPGGFYTFTLSTDASGHVFTQSYCYTADGPDHWVVANGVESNHVGWSAAAQAPPAQTAPQQPATQPPATQPPVQPAPVPESCLSFQGMYMNDDQTLSTNLFLHYIGGSGTAVVVNPIFFTEEPPFVPFAESLPQAAYGSNPPNIYPPQGTSESTDLHNALGNFSVWHTSQHCFAVYDHYDFNPASKFFPFWAIQLFGAREFDVRASGRMG